MRVVDDIVMRTGPGVGFCPGQPAATSLSLRLLHPAPPELDGDQPQVRMVRPVGHTFQHRQAVRVVLVHLAALCVSQSA